MNDTGSDSKILAIARTIRPDAWIDYAARGAFSVGFADNREPATYNTAMGTVAAQLKAAGFKVTVRAADEHHRCTIVRVRA